MDKSNDCLQNDAVPTESFEVARPQEESTEVSLQIPDMILAQNNTSTSYTFNECHGVQLGTVFRVGNLGTEVGVRNAAAVRQHAAHDESAYAKTPTIKEMMENKQPMSPALLDFLSSSFGMRWREVTIRLRIDQIFVDRMYEDHFTKTGTKEVVFQSLTKFLNENPDKNSVGWLITFLWQNKFRKTVWHVKEYYKQLKELEKGFDCE